MKMSRLAALTAITALAASAAGCSTQSSGDSSGTDTIAQLSIIAPANPGSGWDGTARALQEDLQETGLAKRVEVTNVPGASGTVALAQFGASEGRSGTWMASGLAMMSGVITNKTETTLADVTPLARLTGESELIVVPADSPYQTIDELAEAVKADPGSVAIAGGSAGSADHIFLGLWAQAYGIEPSSLNFVPFSGGGEATTALLGSKVAAGVSGTSEFAAQVEAGKLRPLLVSSTEPIESLPDAPTVTDIGKSELDFYNWRSVLAPKGISDADRTTYLAVLDELVGSDQWKETLSANDWQDLYLSGDEFSTWQTSETERVRGVLEDLGLA